MLRCSPRDLDWRTFLWIGDVLSVGASFPITLLVARGIGQSLPPAFDITFLNCLFLAAIVLFFFQISHLYDLGIFVRISLMPHRIILAVLAAGGTFATFRLLAAPAGNLTFLPLLILYCAVSSACVLLGRMLIRYLERYFLKTLYSERIAFIGWGNRMQKVLTAVTREIPNLNDIIGYYRVSNASFQSPPQDSGYFEIGKIREIERHLRSQEISMLLVDEAVLERKELREIADLCADLMVNLRIIPTIFDLWVERLGVQVVGGIPILGIRRLEYDRFLNRFLKRLVDISGALAGLVLSSPLLLILACMIRTESPGPVFFYQTRLGRRNRPFQIIKLRTMRPDAEKASGAVWAVENDPRRLRVGAFMRAWNLDELPQFWNVLRGEMSLVGPRPERPEFIGEFRENFRNYNLRHSCKPGMTGWAAVNGLRGNTSLSHRLDYDLYYILKWSLILDLRIMIMTFAARKNAY